MKRQLTILQIIGIAIFYAAWGYYAGILTISFNPFDVVAPWIATLDIVVLLVGVLLICLGFRFTRKLEAAPWQWIGLGIFLGILCVGAYLFSPHESGVGGILPMVVVVAVIFGWQARTMRKQPQS